MTAVKRSFAVLGHAWSERIRKEKTGEIPQGQGLTGRPANLGFNKTTNKAEIKASIPRLFETYGLDEKDVNDIKNTLRVRREQRAKEKAERQVEAEKSWALQALPIYRMGILLQYSDSSSTHKKIAAEITALPTSTKKQLLKDLVAGKRAANFDAISKDRLDKGITWLSNVIATEA